MPTAASAVGEWEIHTDGMCLLNPMLLFEVLSPSTRDYDCGAKREHYQQIPSLRHLLLIDQPTRSVRHDWRVADGLCERRLAAGSRSRSLEACSPWKTSTCWRDSNHRTRPWAITAVFQARSPIPSIT